MIAKIGTIVLFHVVGVVLSCIFDDFIFLDAIAGLSLVTSSLLDSHDYVVLMMYSMWSIHLSSYFVIRRIKLGKIRSRMLVPSALHAASFGVSRCVWAISIAHTIHQTPQKVLYRTWAEATFMSSIMFGAVAGLALEIVSDYTLLFFRIRDSNHSLCSHGAWSWCRHPNLFGEVTFQLCMSAFVYVVSRDVRCVTAILITVLSVFVLPGGIRTLEERAKHTWGHTPEYKEYVSRTPIVLPYGWFLKRSDASVDSVVPEHQEQVV